MRSFLIPVIFIMTAVLRVLPLSADVIITRDDMILNGKILEDKKPQYVKFANYHGTFTIKYKQIKEIHRTESFEGDVEILQNMGKTVNKEEIKNNYQSGMKKLGKQIKAVPAPADQPKTNVFMINLFAGKNFGRLDTVLPYSRGFSLSAEIPFEQSGVLNMLYISGIECEMDYFYSAKDQKLIKGLSGAAGPLWRVPVTVFDYNFIFNISAAAGIGSYYVKNSAEESSGIKWNMTFHAGPVFDFNPAVISPQLRFDYIYDKVAPLYSAGLSVGAGYKF